MHQVNIEPSQATFSCHDRDTILRAGLRAGIAFPYECNVGSCGNCKFELIEGEVESNWNEAPGLSEKDKQRNRHLGCQSVAKGNVRIKLREQARYAPIHTPVKTAAHFVEQRVITHDISEFAFETDEPIEFSAGQYALIELPGVTGPRAYSMSQAGGKHNRIEFQVRRVPNGIGSQALFELMPQTPVIIDGPYGMAYLREDSSRDVLLVGGGSGLAPMVSLARGALTSSKMTHQQVHFLYGAREERDVCGLDMLETLPNWSERGHYTAVLSHQAPGVPMSPDRLNGFVHEAVASLHLEKLSDFEIYFAGPPLMAQAMLKLLIEQKVPMDQVHFDQFY